MPGLDTNVLVRWIVDDDAQQVRRVQGLFDEVRQQRSMLFVPSTVMLELEWVLRSRYGFDKPEVLGAFNTMLETQQLEFQDEPALERALSLYRQNSADFADCLHAGQCGSAGRAPMITFDDAAARLPGVELLKA
jgi:predicted nucleic-acid-binding protein